MMGETEMVMGMQVEMKGRKDREIPVERRDEGMERWAASSILRWSSPFPSSFHGSLKKQLNPLFLLSSFFFLLFFFFFFCLLLSSSFFFFFLGTGSSCRCQFLLLCRFSGIIGRRPSDKLRVIVSVSVSIVPLSCQCPSTVPCHGDMLHTSLGCRALGIPSFSFELIVSDFLFCSQPILCKQRYDML